MYILTYKRLHIFVYINTHIDMYINTHIDMYINTHIDMHAYIHMLPRHDGARMPRLPLGIFSDTGFGGAPGWDPVTVRMPEAP